jgi:hypothetical protein
MILFNPLNEKGLSMLLIPSRGLFLMRTGSAGHSDQGDLRSGAACGLMITGVLR